MERYSLFEKFGEMQQQNIAHSHVHAGSLLPLAPENRVGGKKHRL
jgi:hypothetical protein